MSIEGKNEHTYQHWLTDLKEDGTPRWSDGMSFEEFIGSYHFYHTKLHLSHWLIPIVSDHMHKGLR